METLRAEKFTDVRFRPLRVFADWEFCRRVASDPEVRELSFDRKPPTFWGHARWMWRWSANDKKRAAWIIVRQARVVGQYLVAPVLEGPLGDVGVLRAWALPGGGCEVGIALLREARSLGVGSMALRRSLLPLSERWGTVYAQVKAENARSVAAFVRAGYECAPEKEWQRVSGGRPGVIVLRWNKEAK